MTHHYHRVECPHCHEILQRGCNLDDCTTATISLEPFVSSDGFEARQMQCSRLGEVYYVDFGDRDLEPAKEVDVVK